MSNFRLLLKTGLINSLNLNKLKIKTREGKLSIFIVFLLILGLLFSFGISFLYMFMIGDSLARGGQPGLILSLGISVSFIFVFITTLTNANGYLFRSKDFELLTSLPIKTSTIFLSKLVNLLIVNYFVLAILYFPTLVVYAIYNPTYLMFWILAIITYLLLPLLPIAVGSVVTYLLGRISSKVRFKNIINIAFSLIIIIFFIFISFNAQMLETDPGKVALILKDLLNKTGEFAYRGLHEKNYLQFTYFITISIIPFSLFVFLIGRSYVSINSKLSSGYVNKNYRITEQIETSPSKALIKKELKRYFSSSSYVLNTIVGPLLTTSMMIFVLVKKDMFTLGIETIISENGGNISELMTYLSLILTASFIFMLGMTSTTACSISIEGKQFWIIKQAPITPKQVFNAKVLVNIIITIPFVLINTIVCMNIFPIRAIDALFIFIIPSIFSIYMSYIGLFLNLLKPKFDYDSEVKVVKQSMSVLFTLLVGFISVSIIIGLSVVAIMYLNIFSGFLVGLLVSTLLMMMSMALIYTKGVKIYNRLNG